ncbi:MAG TPA: hypothetical protein VMR98_06095, partial [Candidatus Polarisedimenticolaceae bacterium]|nr:hypothetical protein [Candidatus Polarisedimenticolaceae bacterium]
TAAFISRHLLGRGAATVDLVVLVQKRKDKGRNAYPEASLFGFEAPDSWVVGMGMDDPRVGKEGYRWADYIAITETD